jgi:hypothetical protein
VDAPTALGAVEPTLKSTNGEVRMMADSGEQATQHMTRVREILPRSASIIEAFRSVTGRDHPGQLVLNTAKELAAQHEQQWQAEDDSRASGASAYAIAESKRLIDHLNARRIGMVERIDEWVSTQVHAVVPQASLHTETLGSVVDRLAIAWVRANSLINSGGTRDRARLALQQLAELADAYDDLIRDVDAGDRRLPAWRPLKTYRSAS